MKTRASLAISALLSLAACAFAQADRPNPIRPPAVPLVTHDPYFSVWSAADKLTDCWPTHWTGATHGMCGLVKIDGKPFRFMGAEPKDIPALEQKSVQVLPTRTLYKFTNGAVQLNLTFVTPLLPDDIDLMSRPLTYIVWDVESLDGKEHEVALHLDVSGELAVNDAKQAVVWNAVKADGLEAVRMGSKEQPVLAKSGDNLRIDWGYAYLAAAKGQGVQCTVVSDKVARGVFAGQPVVPAGELSMPRAASDQWPVMSLDFTGFKVGKEKVRRLAMLAYDDLYSIDFMGKHLRGYWCRNGMDANGLLLKAAVDFAVVEKRCREFDDKLMDQLTELGGEKYAAVSALCYRQSIAAHKIVSAPNGDVWFFSKENFSNGCIATVDVTYPSCPLFLALSPTLLKGMISPVMEYASSDKWKYPYAPHDLGVYPKATGQVYGMKSKDDGARMPVEECANMLIMFAALADAEGNSAYTRKYWTILEKWAGYLLEKGLDPDNQLCSDDFMGHLTHNANLSIKAIIGIGAFGKLCKLEGKTEDAEKYRAEAEKMAAQWQKLAGDEGGWYRLAFDKPGTWSQKYNLIWDRVLGLNLFPKEIANKEMAGYRVENKLFGLALDPRKPWCLLDWIAWTASLTDNKNDFNAIMEPVYRYVHETPSRVPLSDWWDVNTGRAVGFQARSVVGSIFMPMLTDAKVWRKWAGKPETPYLFTYFVKNGEDGLHLAWSKDGYTWDAIQDGRSILRPTVGHKEKLMRDPCVTRGPDGTYHMVWTTGWWSNCIGYASTKDFITWSEQRELPVMAHEPTTRNSWAPEIIYDDKKGEFVIFWSSTIPDRFPRTGGSEDGLNHRIYSTTTKDFKTFTPTKLFYDPGFSVIDATFLQADGQLHLILKDERLNPPRKYLQMATAESCAGPFGALTKPFSPSGVWVEGPTALKIGDEYLVYYDAYTTHRYGALRSRDLKTWEDVSAKIKFPFEGTPNRVRHGTAIQVPRALVDRLCLTSPASAVSQPVSPAIAPASSMERWSEEKAWAWYKKQPWLVGFNFVPSTACNSTEMWQAETFDPATMDRELGWAKDLGFNTTRVFTQYIVWKQDPEGFKKRFEKFLELADKHGITVMPTLFDDVALGEPKQFDPFLGKQREPIPGMLAPSWTPSPGIKLAKDPAERPMLKKYVHDMLTTYGKDKRVIVWDLYNEPMNVVKAANPALLEEIFTWGRAVNPNQPLTIAEYNENEVALNQVMHARSDVISFHRYADIAVMQNRIATFKKQGRPVLCTEWLARHFGSKWETDLAMFKQQGVGCYNWGLVNGRTQCQFVWDSKPGSPESKVWYHDLFHKDGRPYDPAEHEVIRKTSADKTIDWTKNAIHK